MAARKMKATAKRKTKKKGTPQSAPACKRRKTTKKK
jgi:hypothetical protein